MTMKPTDTIIGPSRGTAVTAKASFRQRGALRLADVDAYVDAVYALCAPDDMPDAAIVVSAADVETGTFTNAWWQARLNAGSLGVTGDPVQNGVSPTFATGADAARAHVAHLVLYATGDISRGGLSPWDDPRFAAYRHAYGAQAFPTLNDLSGRYAADTGYGATIARRSQAIYGDLPDQTAQEESPVADQLVFGRVPHPAYHDRPIYKTPGVGMDNLGKRDVIGVTWHRILGSLRGTDGYFRDPSVGALTDYGLGVKATDGAGLSGTLYRWNDPLGFQSGWASGKVIAPWGDGLAFVNKYGVNAVNKRRASLEISGQYGTPLTPEEKAVIAQWTAYWADQDGIPWDVFPIRPEDGFSFVCWHQEFTGSQEKICPGQVVIDATPELIEMTCAILKRFQTGGAPQPETPDGTTYAAPITYPWLAKEEADKGLDRMIGRTRVFYVPQVYTAIRETPRKQATGKNEQVIGPPIEAGLTFKADYCYRSAGVSYVLTPYGTRVRAADLLPKIQISPRGTVSIRRKQDSAPEIARKAGD